MEHGSAEQFWDREVSIEAFHSTNWMQNPVIHESINASIGTPERPLWPLDWFEEWLGARRPFRRALSIGCGTGALERDLIRRNLFESIDAFDGSIASLGIAREEAEKAGMRARIRYFAGDFNRPALPRAHYDVVFVHQAMHHVGKLEKLFRAILHALKPNGLLYLDEYIGPSRHEWTEDRYRAQRKWFATVPDEYVYVRELPYPIVPQDPSEAIRSGEIMDQLNVGFDIRAFRGYGGNLLAPIYPAINWSVAPDGLLERLIRSERELLASGERSFHAVIVAAPKRGLRGKIASARYFTEPKLKRIIREIRKP
jgi:SAM-dependent methyltransferase